MAKILVIKSPTREQTPSNNAQVGVGQKRKKGPKEMGLKMICTLCPVPLGKFEDMDCEACLNSGRPL